MKLMLKLCRPQRIWGITRTHIQELRRRILLSLSHSSALVLSRKPYVKLSLFAKGVALLLVDTVDLFGLTLDDSLKFENTLRKLARKLERN